MKKNLIIAALNALVLLMAVSCGSATVPDDDALAALGLTPIRTDTETPVASFLDSEGMERRLDEFRGSVVLLNFWATWCPPCLAEMPSMSVLYNELDKLEFEMVAVNVGESPELVAAFVREFDIDFPVYLDPDSRAAAVFGVGSIPTTLIIDRNGDARAYLSGAYEWDTPEVIELFRDWSR